MQTGAFFCPFFDEETNGSYPFANELNGLACLWEKGATCNFLQLIAQPTLYSGYRNLSFGKYYFLFLRCFFHYACLSQKVHVVIVCFCALGIA
jgi:hypothetical protein